MKNDHDKNTCWHCVRNHVFTTVKCASDLTGKTPQAIYNNEGRHFRIVKDGGVFLHKRQVMEHIRILLEKGICKGKCALVINQQAE